MDPAGPSSDSRPDEYWPPWAGARRVHGGSLFLPLMVAAIQLIGSTIADYHLKTGRALNGTGYALLLIGPAALVMRRYRPVTTLVITLAVAVGYLAADFPSGPFFLATLGGIVAAARRIRRELLWAICAAAYVAYVGLAVSGVWAVGAASLGSYIVPAVFTAAVLALAEAIRVRAEHFRQLGQTRAAAARARQEQTRRQASDERLRIARELHDVLGHHLSLINVRANVALHLLESRPDEVRQALGAIKLASAEALREVRAVLATLNPVEETAPRSPAHGLADLDDLVAQAVAADLPVTIRREGAVRPLPPEVDRAAYRIVQEALTNVRRHAGAAAIATVQVGYEPEALRLRVDDTGTGASTSTVDTDGNGIPGMRERAAALGGTLVTGPGPAGGFRVEAVLPTLASDEPRVLARDAE